MINKIKAWIANNKRLKKGIICKLEHSLKQDLLMKGRKEDIHFYQSYPPLNIIGTRGTICRFKTYNMEKYINKNMNVLDIGSNLGFFSAYLSKYVRQIIALEPLKYLINITRKLMEEEKIGNMYLINEPFEDFGKSEKYDLILSLAVHDFEGTNGLRVRLSFKKYLDKLASHLNKGGLVLFESHGVFYKTGEHDIEERIKLNKNFSIIQKGEIDDYDGMIRKFFWLKKK